MEKELHRYLKQKTKEKLSRDGYKVDDSSGNVLFAVNEAGIDVNVLSDGSWPDLIAIKEKEVLVIDVVDKTYASEMAEKVEKYGKIGKVVFVMPAESLENVQFWSIDNLGISLSEMNNNL